MRSPSRGRASATSRATRTASSEGPGHQVSTSIQMPLNASGRADYDGRRREHPADDARGHEPPDRLRQAADAVLGAREPRAGGQDRRQARRRPRADHAQDLQERRGLLPLRGVDPRRGRLPHPADLRQPRDGHHRQRRADGAAGDDRRGDRRLARTASSPSRRGTATAARTRSPRRASRSAPASSPA